MTGIRPSAVATRRNSVRGGGSSSAFNNALAAFWLRSSARSTMTTRHPASPALWPRKLRRRRTSSTPIHCE